MPGVLFFTKLKHLESGAESDKATHQIDHVPSSVRLDSSSCLWLLWQLR
jgi:hypothetical protein